MKFYICLKIFVALICLVFLNDFILALAGRDTFFSHLYPPLFDLGIAVILAGFVLMFIEVFRLLAEKKWIKAASLCAAAYRTTYLRYRRYRWGHCCGRCLS